MRVLEAIAIATFCKNSASNAPMNPSTSANVNISNGVGSCTKRGASSNPAANPTAATASQNNLRPNNRTITPINALAIGTEKFTTAKKL